MFRTQPSAAKAFVFNTLIRLAARLELYQTKKYYSLCSGPGEGRIFFLDTIIGVR
jgi:hypothetical protein